MLRLGRLVAALACLASCTAPAPLAAPPPIAAAAPSPAAVALRAAADATGAALVSDLADLPGRGRLAVRRAGAAAIAPWRDAGPLPALAAWAEPIRNAVGAAATLRSLTRSAGGSLAAADRALDAAALGAVALLGLRLALRARGRRR